MIKKSEKVIILVLCMVFIASLALTVYMRVSTDIAGFQNLSSFSHSGNLPYTIDGLININVATAEQLQILPGIGPGLSQRIVADRKRNGPFRSPEDILRVKGIGQKTYEKFQALISTGGQS